MDTGQFYFIIHVESCHRVYVIKINNNLMILMMGDDYKDARRKKTKM